MYEHNALGYRWTALCLTKVRSSQARCRATALISQVHYWNPLAILFALIWPVCDGQSGWKSHGLICHDPALLKVTYLLKTEISLDNDCTH